MAKRLLMAGLFIITVMVVGCSSNSTAPLAAFEPEIVNSADDFQFQATDITNVNTQVTYNWPNSGTQASIDHSSAITAGSASIMLYDQDDSLVYSNGLVASLNEATAAGTPGTWRLVVNLTNCSGTLNFRAQALN
jgi:hypothetical protein